MNRKPNLARLAQLAAKKARREARSAARADTVPPSTKDTPDMNKADADIEVICGLARTKLDRIIRNIDKARQEKDDANTAHASEWKGAKDNGVPTEPLKLCFKLDRMSEDKRRDFLKAFDELRGTVYRRWSDQPDMFEQAAVDESAESSETVEDDSEPLPLFDSAAEEQIDGPAADWGADPVNAASDEELNQAGHWFSDGQAAGAVGAPAEANPHEDGTLAAATWEKGRLQGAVALADEPDPYKTGWAAHKAGSPRDVSQHVDWLKGWDERDEKWNREAKKAATAEAKAEGDHEDSINVVPFLASADGAVTASALR